MTKQETEICLHKLIRHVLILTEYFYRLTIAQNDPEFIFSRPIARLPVQFLNEQIFTLETDSGLGNL